MRIKHSKTGAAMIDVMLAIIFFAVFSASFFRLIFGTGEISVVDDLDLLTQRIEFQNNITEYIQSNLVCPTPPACSTEGGCDGVTKACAFKSGSGIDASGNINPTSTLATTYLGLNTDGKFNQKIQAGGISCTIDSNNVKQCVFSINTKSKVSGTFSNTSKIWYVVRF